MHSCSAVVTLNNRARVAVVAAGFPALDCERTVLGSIGADVVDGRNLRGPEALMCCQKADAIMSDYFAWTAEAIQQLERCRVICQYGVGLDQIDIDAATRAGIVISHTPEYCIDELADHTFALLLAAARKIVRYDRSVREGGWDYNVGSPIRKLRGQTLGLIGLGRVSRAVALRAHGFGLRVIACDPYQPPEVFSEVGAERMELDELLVAADIVSLHLAFTPETREIIGAKQLALLRPAAILVNTARGGLIDEKALAKALRSGQLVAAGLDVLSEEPPARDEDILQLENLIVTPHAGFLSVESLIAVQKQAAEEVRRALTGEKLIFAVNQQAL